MIMLVHFLPIQIDHVESYLSATHTFSEISDPSAGPIAPYLTLLLHKMVCACLLKHSKRPDSAEVNYSDVTNWKLTLTSTFIYTGYEDVERNKFLKTIVMTEFVSYI